MSAEKKYTEREMLSAQRTAVERAISVAWPWIRATEHGTPWIGSDAIRDDLYPLPTVTRPRIVRDPHCNSSPGDDGLQNEWHWRVEGANVVLCDANGARFRPPYAPGLTEQRVSLWADLLSAPAETVEEET